MAPFNKDPNYSEICRSDIYCDIPEEVVDRMRSQISDLYWNKIVESDDLNLQFGSEKEALKFIRADFPFTFSLLDDHGHQEKENYSVFRWFWTVRYEGLYQAFVANYDLNENDTFPKGNINMIDSVVDSCQVSEKGIDSFFYNPLVDIGKQEDLPVLVAFIPWTRVCDEGSNSLKDDFLALVKEEEEHCSRDKIAIERRILGEYNK